MRGSSLSDHHTCSLTPLLCLPTPNSRHPDLLEPHILRSLSNVKAVSVHTSCAGCHTIVLDIEGTAWLFGRNQPAALGITNVDTISENAPSPLRATDLGAPPGTIFVNAACGRSHSVLIGSNGRVWTAGLNALGQVIIIKKSSSRLCYTLKKTFETVRTHALRGSQHIHARKRASESGNGRVGARMRRSCWHHIYAIPYRKRKEHVMLAFCSRVRQWLILHPHSLCVRERREGPAWKRTYRGTYRHRKPYGF